MIGQIRKLSPAFYARATEQVARALLGCYLVSDVGGRRTIGRIVETEAYVGPHDPACHGYGGRPTRRTAHLFGPPGTAYVYRSYGMHWCLNAVTERDGYPAAVLIRALEPMGGLEVMRLRRRVRGPRNLCAGPGRLCQALGITGWFGGHRLTEPPLRICRPSRLPRLAVQVSGRIGISRATDWPLRFALKGSVWVSR